MLLPSVLSLCLCLCFSFSFVFLLTTFTWLNVQFALTCLSFVPLDIKSFWCLLVRLPSFHLSSRVLQVLSGWLRPHAQILLASEDASQGGNGRDDQTTKTMARQWFEMTHKSMGRLAPVIALLAILRCGLNSLFCNCFFSFITKPPICMLVHALYDTLVLISCPCSCPLSSWCVYITTAALPGLNPSEPSRAELVWWPWL